MGCFYFYPRSPCGERRNGDTHYSYLRKYFYPRSPCGERPLGDVWACRWPDISIHALLAESDLCAFVSLFGVFLFLSTLSLRRATCASPFSIFWICHFYPRSPCGERHLQHLPYGANSCISIHALLAESDSVGHRFAAFPLYFYPRSPCGERRTLRRTCGGFLLFLSTLSLRRATVFSTLSALSTDISIHALLAESDRG